jgi:xanthine dehydrogenase accessory factor
MRALYAEILRLLDSRVPFTLCTVVESVGSVPAKDGAKMVVLADGTTFGTVGGAGLEERAKAIAREAMASGRGRIESFDLARWREGGLDSVCGGTVRIAFDPHPVKPHLLLAGGGHVALALARAAALLEYGVTVVDDRPEFADSGRFPAAREVIIAPPSWFADADLARFSHVFLVGYDHNVDAEILVHVARRFRGRIGVIGSQAKKRSLWERARAAGIPDSALDRIECPLGLPIGARTPEEIAVAILASVIKSERQPSRPGDDGASEPGVGERAHAQAPFSQRIRGGNR